MATNTTPTEREYTEAEPYEGECYAPNYWVCEHEPGVTLQEYASSHNLSYEAVRKKVKQYKDELIPHIRIKFNTQFLDDKAVEFLENHSRGYSGTIQPGTPGSRIRQSKADLLAKISELERECSSLKEALEEKQKACDELSNDLDDLRRQKMIDSNTRLIQEKRTKKTIDVLFSMLREKNVFSAEDYAKLIDVFTWDGVSRLPWEPKPESLDTDSN